MFEMSWGFQEIILIMVIALLVLGPERLPDFARKAGIWVAKIKRFLANVKEDIDREVAADELKRIIEEQRKAASNIDEIIEETKQAFADMERDYQLGAIDDRDLDNETKKSSDNNKADDKDSASELDSKPRILADNKTEKPSSKAVDQDKSKKEIKETNKSSKLSDQNAPEAKGHEQALNQNEKNQELKKQNPQEQQTASSAASTNNSSSVENADKPNSNQDKQSSTLS